MIWTMQFWKGAGERALKTLAQVLAAAFVVGVPVNAVDVRGALLLAATAVVASLLTSILNADFTAGPPVAFVSALPPLPAFAELPVPNPATVQLDDAQPRAPADPLVTAEPLYPTDRAAARRAAKIARSRGE